MHKERFKETLSVFLLFLLAAATFTWPLVAHFHEAIPLGSEPEAVAYFQLFTMKWTAQTLTQPQSYWHAQFFYPFPGTFAWCEPQLFNALMSWILALLFGWLAGYNGMILANMALMGLGGYCASRLLTGDRVAAFLSGLWLCSGAFALQQICSPALLCAWSIFFFIIFVFLFASTAAKKYFWLALLCYLVSWFSLKQSALTLTLLVPSLIWPYFRQPVRYRHLFVGLFVILMLAAAVVVPYTAQQWHFTRVLGFEWTLSELRTINPLSLFVPAQYHWLSWRLGGVRLYSWDIGIVVCLVLTAAVTGGFLRRHAFDTDQKKIVASLATLAALGLFLALGMNLKTYRFLFDHVPGFSFIRVPGRNIIFTVFALSVLAAPAFAWLRQRMRTSMRLIATAAVFVLLSMEMWTMPIPLVNPQKEFNSHRGVISWLKDRDRSAPVMELPLKPGSCDLEAAAMLRMLEHRHPLVNGYATFVPLPYLQLKRALKADLSGKGIRFIHAYGARYALVHEHLLSGQETLSLASVLGEKPVFKEPDHALYQLPYPVYDIGKQNPDFLPKKSYFGSNEPAEGKGFSLPLKSALSEAQLVYLPQALLPMEWEDKRGTKEKVLVLHGAVIVDKGEDRLCFRMLRFSQNGKAAEGLIVHCK